jgi:hypothetical protein
VQRDPDHTNVYAVCELAADNTQTLTVVAVQTIDDVDTRTRSWSVTINGLTPVLVVTEAVAIQTIKLNPVAAGTVALFDAPTGGHRLASIQPGEHTVQYLAFASGPHMDAYTTKSTATCGTSI